MKKIQKILLTVLCGVLFVPLSAQDEESGYAPKAGDIQMNLLLGKGMFYSNIEDVLLIERNAEVVGDYWLTTDLPYYLTLSNPNSNSIGNMIGVEFKYFIMDNIAVSLSGAGFVNKTPWVEAVDPVTTSVGGSKVTVLPAYVNIDAQLQSRMVLNVGGQYYFNVGNERIRPYAGLMGTFQFASIQAQSTYAGYDQLEEEKRDAGMRTGQIFGWSPSLVAGVEYSVLPGLLVGFEFKPVSMYYSGIRLFAQPGLEALTGQNLDWTYFAQPQFKIGFRFSEFSLF